MKFVYRKQWKILLAKINDTNIWVCWKNGKGADDIHKELVIAEGTKALSKRTIYRWIEAFEGGQSSIEDALPVLDIPAKPLHFRTLILWKSY